MLSMVSMSLQQPLPMLPLVAWPELGPRLSPFEVGAVAVVAVEQQQLLPPPQQRHQATRYLLPRLRPEKDLMTPCFDTVEAS